MLVSRLWARQRACLHRAQFFSHLTSVSENDIAHFSKILAPSSIISTLSKTPSKQEELEPFNNDWMNRFHGRATTVLKPKSTQEVSDIMRWCNERRIGVVPQGGNTGLVGGSVPLDDEVILSLSNLNKVRAFDPVSGQYSYSYP
jgi:FAD/FMN-containing dehydrogenase